LNISEAGRLRITCKNPMVKNAKLVSKDWKIYKKSKLSKSSRLNMQITSLSRKAKSLPTNNGYKIGNRIYTKSPSKTIIFGVTLLPWK
jgi:hypothetical protein